MSPNMEKFSNFMTLISNKTVGIQIDYSSSVKN